MDSWQAIRLFHNSAGLLWNGNGLPDAQFIVREFLCLSRPGLLQ